MYTFFCYQKAKQASSLHYPIILLNLLQCCIITSWILFVWQKPQIEGVVVSCLKGRWAESMIIFCLFSAVPWFLKFLLIWIAKKCETKPKFFLCFAWHWQIKIFPSQQQLQFFSDALVCHAMVGKKNLVEWTFKSRYIDVRVGHYLLFVFSPPKIS